MKRMRLYIILVFTISACSTTLPALGPSENLMDKADTIYITSQDEPVDSYRRIAQIITDHGFSIEYSDPTLMILNTNPLLVDGVMEFTMKLNISVRENVTGNTVVRLTGDWTRTNVYKEISNYTSKLDVRRDGWLIMTEIAESYPNATITYSRNL